MNDLFNSLAKMYNIYWYLNGTILTFEFITTITASTELFNSETYFKTDFNKSNENIEFLDIERPDIESFTTELAVNDGFQKLNFVYETPLIKKDENQLNIICDLANLINVNEVNEGYLICGCDVLEVRGDLVNSFPVLNYLFSWYNPLAFYLINYRPFDSAFINLLSSTETLNGTISKPILKNMISTYLTYLFNTDHKNKYITTGIGEGNIKSAELDVLSGVIVWNLEYYELTFNLIDDLGNYIVDDLGNYILVV